MTAERFTYYLNNPSHLYQISYQELKSLVVQYPYCQNLRYLLVTKSQIDDSTEYQQDLQLAATYSADRNYLYHLVNHDVNTLSGSDSFILNDDYLELKDISETTIESNSTAAPIVLGSLAGVSAGLAADNLEAPSATKTKDDYVPYERIVKRIKRVNNNELSEIEEVPEPIAQEETSEPVVDTINSETVDETHLEFTEDPTIEIIEEPEVIEENQVADNISDEPEMIAYMEKPKKRRSVIDQLLGRTPLSIDNVKENDEVPTIDEVTNTESVLEDEMESPSIEENTFLDLTPVKDVPTYGRDVLFEITNKTEKEMDAIMQKNQFKDDEAPLPENIITMSDTPEKTISELKDKGPSVPTPKTSFKSYLEQFQPPTGEIEDEKEIANIIEETVEEAKQESDMIITSEKSKEKKKGKSKTEKIKSKKQKKEKKKKKAKSLVKKVAKESVQESDDIFSETLAELLAEQGSRKKAIRMYKRLSLIFPKKSSFFAEKIKRLKK